MKIGTKACALLTPGFLVLLLAACNKGIPDDGANAKTVHVDNFHLVRYLEIFVVGGNPITGDLRANVYNTSLVPNPDPRPNRDTALQAYAEGLNTEAIKKQFGALGVAINGPNLWMIDFFDIPLGADREFNGRKIPWCATLHLTKSEMEQMAK